MITKSDTAMDLNRLERQSRSSLAKLGYRALDGVCNFGQNIVDQFEGESFAEVKDDLDRLVKQTNFTPAKVGVGAMGVFYAVGSTAFKLPSDLAQGAVAILTDTIHAVKSIPEGVMHNSDEIVSGVGDIHKGRISKGTARIVSAVTGDCLVFEGARMAVKAAPVAYAAYAEGVNRILSSRPTKFSIDPFDIAVRNDPQFGGARMGGMPTYAEVGSGIVKQLKRLGDVKDGMFPAHENPAILVREIEVMQEEFGFQRYHFYVRINFDGVGPTFELSIGRLYFKTFDDPIGNAVWADAVSMRRATPSTVTYAQLGLTAHELETLPTHEALGVVHKLVPEMASMLEKLERLAVPVDVN